MSRRAELIRGAAGKIAEAKRLGGDAQFVRALHLIDAAEADLRESDRLTPDDPAPRRRSAFSALRGHGLSVTAAPSNLGRVRA